MFYGEGNVLNVCVRTQRSTQSQSSEKMVLQSLDFIKFSHMSVIKLLVP